MELWRRLSMGEGPSADDHVHTVPEENARGFFRFRLHSGLKRMCVKEQVKLNQARTLNSYMGEAARIMASPTHLSICADATRIGGNDILAILFCCFSDGRWICFWAPPQVVMRGALSTPIGLTRAPFSETCSLLFVRGAKSGPSASHSLRFRRSRFCSGK